jgi:GNAT superfamily N-acetyltransferase
MPFVIRPTAESDYPRVVAIQNTRTTNPITLEQYQHQISTLGPDERRLRLVAATRDGLVVGMAGVVHTQRWDPPGRYFGRVRVDGPWQGQGAGNALFAAVDGWCRAEGAACLETEISESDPGSLTWAERRGFARQWLLFRSALDLAAWSPEPFQANLGQVEASGIRISTLGAEARGPADLRRYYELRKRLYLDVAVVGQVPFGSYEEWTAFFLGNPAFDGGNITLAIAGDDWVGLTELEPQAGADFENGLTGVDPAYRGRGVALALKTVSLSRAKGLGARCVTTDNHSANGPMLAVNRKLGYLAAPGRWQYVLTYR